MHGEATARENPEKSRREEADSRRHAIKGHLRIFLKSSFLDHTSSSLLLFTNSISQIYLENGKKTEDRKIQLSGAGTD